MSLAPIPRLPSSPPILSALPNRFLALLPTCKPSSLRGFPPVFLLTPLDSALTDSCARKSFRIRSYEKTWGAPPPLLPRTVSPAAFSAISLVFKHFPALLRPPKTQPSCFQTLSRSLRKKWGIISPKPGNLARNSRACPFLFISLLPWFLPSETGWETREVHRQWRPIRGSAGGAARAPSRSSLSGC